MLKIRIKKLDIIDMLAIITIVLNCTAFIYKDVALFALIDRLSIKHFTGMLVMGLTLYSQIKGSGIKKGEYWRYLRNALLICAGLVFISFLYMFKNGWATYWVKDIYYFIYAALFVYCVFSRDNSLSKFDYYIDCFFAALSVVYLYYVIINIPRLSAGAISFANSSSPFEFNTAHLFLLFFMYYCFREKRAKQIIAFIFTILSWKRLCMVYAVLFAVGHFLIPKNKPVKRGYLYLLAGIVVFIPQMVQFMLTDTFAEWFYNTTGIDFVKFLMSRFQVINQALSISDQSRGLGTFIFVSIEWYGKDTNFNLHNDILRLYIETSAVGLGIFTFGLATMGKSWYSFFTVAYMFIALSGTHLLNAGSIPYWVLLYICMYCYDTYGVSKQVKLEGSE